MNTLFSIIIPVYNTKQYLNECLESVLYQDYASYEIILIDDGSTDGSGEICDGYVKKSTQIRVIHKENEGLSSARNTGIEASKGDYILFLDSDDIILQQNALSTLAKSIDKYNPDMLLYLPKEYNHNFSSVLIEHKPFDLDINQYHDTVKLIDELYREAGIYVTMAQTKIVRRKFCVKNDLFFTPGIYHEDDDWIARVFMSNPQIAFCPYELYGYRHRNNSIITTTNVTQNFKKANDRLNTALKLLNRNDITKYSHMHNYFINYYVGAYAQILDYDKKDKASPHTVPFYSFHCSHSKKIQLLGRISQVFGYRIAKLMFRRYLLCKK